MSGLIPLPRAYPEEANQAVPQSPRSDQSSNSSADADFGANEWLVQEMYEQYQKDPASVGPAWSDYFKDHAAVSGQSSAAQTPAAKPAAQQAVKQESAPAKQAAPAAQSAPAKPAPTGNGSAAPTPKATPRPAAAAAEPATGKDKPVAKDARPARAGPGQRRADLHGAARRPGAGPPRTWTPP